MYAVRFDGALGAGTVEESVLRSAQFHPERLRRLSLVVGVGGDGEVEACDAGRELQRLCLRDVVPGRGGGAVLGSRVHRHCLAGGRLHESPESVADPEPHPEHEVLALLDAGVLDAQRGRIPVDDGAGALGVAEHGAVVVWVDVQDEGHSLVVLVFGVGQRLDRDRSADGIARPEIAGSERDRGACEGVGHSGVVVARDGGAIGGVVLDRHSVDDRRGLVLIVHEKDLEREVFALFGLGVVDPDDGGVDVGDGAHPDGIVHGDVGGAPAGQHEMQRLGILRDLVGEGLHRDGRGGARVAEPQRPGRHRRIVPIRRVTVPRSCRGRQRLLALLGRLALHLVVHVHVLAGTAPDQSHGEGHHLALEGAGIVDGEFRRVAVGDGAGRGIDVQVGLVRVAQHDPERLVGLVVAVGQKPHRHGLRGDAGPEGEPFPRERIPDGCLVVDTLLGRSRRCLLDPVGHRHRVTQAGRDVQLDSEALGAVLGAGEARYGQPRRVDVLDGAGRVDLVDDVVAVAAEQDRSAGVGEGQAQRLGVLVGRIVAHQLHRHLDLGGASSSEGERARQVQRVRRRCPEIVDRCGRVGPGVAGDRVVHGHILARAGTAQTHGEGLGGALGSGEAGDGEHRRVHVLDNADPVDLSDVVVGVAAGQDCSAGVGKGQAQLLGPLYHRVMQQAHIDGAAGVACGAWFERHCADERARRGHRLEVGIQ